MVRTPACQAGGRGFESRLSRKFSMKKIFQIGAGLVGKTMAHDLSRNFDLHLADSNINLLQKIKSELNHIHTHQLDVTNKESLSKWIKDADSVLLAVPGFLGFDALKTIIESGKDVVDISFSPENVLILHDLAVKNDVCAVVDAGVAPGIPNFVLGYWNSQLEVDAFEYVVGGLPKNPIPPYYYKAPFSPTDVIEEYTRPARMMIDSKIVIKPALSEIEILDILDVEKLEAFNTDGLRSLLTTMTHIPNMKEKTLRYPGHAELMQSLYDKGLFNEENIKQTATNLFKDWELGKNEKEFTVLDINIYSSAKNIKYHLYDEFDEDTTSSSMARTTGYTATATVNMLANNLWDKKGVHPPEIVGSNKKCFDFLLQYLMDRNISLTLL